jgi:photosystem II stability/assembly factor-like uncharacterized protein
MVRWNRAAMFSPVWLAIAVGCSDPEIDPCEGASCPPVTTPDGGVDAGEPSVDGGSPIADAGSSIGSFAPAASNAAWFGSVTATPTAVFVSTGTGVRRSRDGGETWTRLELPAEDLIAMTANGSELIATTAWNTLHSSDDGDSWRSVHIELPSSGVRNPSYVTTYGGEVYLIASSAPFVWNRKSESWDLIDVPFGEADRGFEVIESDGARLYGAPGYRPGVFVLDLAAPETGFVQVEELGEWGYPSMTFAGEEGFTVHDHSLFRRDASGWTELAAPFEAGPDLLFDRGVLYAASSHGLFESTDRGETWIRPVSDAFSSRFSLTTDGTNVYAASDGAFWRKRPESSWEKLPLVADEVWSLVSTGGELFSISAGGFQRRTDGGWEQVTGVGRDDVAGPFSTPPEAPILTSSIVAQGDAVVVNAVRFGTYGSDDGGRTFEHRSVLGARHMIAFQDGVLAFDYERREMRLSNDGGRTWDLFGEIPYDVRGFDDFEEVDGVFYALSGWFSYRSTDRGETWERMGFESDVSYLRAFVGVGDAVVAAAPTFGTLRSTDRGTTWQRVALDGPVSSLATHGDVLFAGVGFEPSNEGGVWFSRDHGVSWARLDPEFTERVSALAVHEDTLYAGTLDSSVWALPLGR